MATATPAPLKDVEREGVGGGTDASKSAFAHVENAPMVSLMSLAAPRHNKSHASKPRPSIHDELMQDHSVRRLGDEPVPSSWSDGSYRICEEEEEEELVSPFGSIERVAGGSTRSADRIISRFAKMFDQMEGEEIDGSESRSKSKSEEEDEGVEEEEGRGSGSGKREGGKGGARKESKEPSQRGGGVQILYIQMEYCEKTLSD